MRLTRILLIDDHTAIRQALRMMLESEADMAVVGEAGDGARGVSPLPRSSSRTSPSSTSPCPAWEASPPFRHCGRRRRGRRFSSSRCTRTRPTYTRRCAPARAAISSRARTRKSCCPRSARSAPARGYLQPRITGTVLRRLVGDARARRARPVALTAREIADPRVGRRRQEQQGDRRGDARIAEDTVKTHLRRLFEKLGAADRAHAVAIALRQKPHRLIAVTRSGDTPRHSIARARLARLADGRVCARLREVRPWSAHGASPQPRRRGRRQSHRTPRGPRPGATTSRR